MWWLNHCFQRSISTSGHLYFGCFTPFGHAGPSLAFGDAGPSPAVFATFKPHKFIRLRHNVRNHSQLSIPGAGSSMEAFGRRAAPQLHNESIGWESNTWQNILWAHPLKLPKLKPELLFQVSEFYPSWGLVSLQFLDSWLKKQTKQKGDIQISMLETCQPMSAMSAKFSSEGRPPTQICKQRRDSQDDSRIWLGMWERYKNHTVTRWQWCNFDAQSSFCYWAPSCSAIIWLPAKRSVWKQANFNPECLRETSWPTASFTIAFQDFGYKKCICIIHIFQNHMHFSFCFSSAI